VGLSVAEAFLPVPSLPEAQRFDVKEALAAFVCRAPFPL